MIQKANFDDATVARLIELSRSWEEENSTFGYRANTKEDLQEPCFIALDGATIIGYGFGHFYQATKKTAIHEIDDCCFEVDELFVLKAYRSQGIGKQLMEALEKEARSKAKAITLVTATKDYKKVLHFYDACAGMTFHDAYMFKKL